MSSGSSINLDLDIVKNISLIEKQKCDILSETAALFQNMTYKNAESKVLDNREILSRLLVDVYILAQRIGIDYQSLDETAKKQLRASLLSEHAYEHALKRNKSELLKHLNRDICPEMVENKGIGVDR